MRHRREDRGRARPASSVAHAARRRPATARATRASRRRDRSPASGVSTTLRSRYSVGERRRRARVLGAGDRMAGNEARQARRRDAARAAAMTSCLVLPASVTMRRGPSCRRDRARTAPETARPASRRSTTSASASSRVQSSSSVTRAVDDAARERRVEVGRVRPTPTTSPHRARAPSAPARTSRRSGRRRRRRACRPRGGADGHGWRRARQRASAARERGEEALVLGRQADRDAQALAAGRSSPTGRTITPCCSSAR